MAPVTVYGSGGQPAQPPVGPGRDRLLLVAGAVGGVLLLLGVLFAAGLTPFGPAAEPPPQAGTPAASARADPAGSATATPTGPADAGPTPSEASGGTLRSVAASLCLEPDGSGDGGGDDDGVAVRQVACSGAPEQLWRIDPDGDVATVVNVATGRCLDVRRGSRDNQAPVVLSDCRPRDRQRWRTPPTGNGFALVSVVSDRCLDVPAASAEPGLRMQQFDCNGTGAQQWIFGGGAGGGARGGARGR
jgi:hypothetical protein